MTAAVLACGVLLAGAAWAYMFLLPREGLWVRTAGAAVTLSLFSVGALAVLDRLEAVIRPVTEIEILIGVAVGGGWLASTHLGSAVLSRLLPGFDTQVAGVYRMGADGSPPVMVGAVLAMGAAEELLFRGLLQDQLGWVLATVLYAGVQAVERKWVLVLAALAGGVVWGGLFAWRDGLVAPVVAHVLWTGGLTFVWPLPTGGESPARDPVSG